MRVAVLLLVLLTPALAPGAAAPPAAAPAPAAEPAAAPVAAAVAVDDAVRVAAYREFRSAFDARDFKAALPLAEKLVALTEQQYGAEDRQLVNPLSNLGATRYRLGDYAAAEVSFLRALRLIDGKASGADRQLIRPLQGLGETYLAARRHDEAAIALKRAVDLSRNLDGLFNIEQLDSLDPLIECYMALDRLQDGEKESQYAFRVAELGYGRDDLRMLEPLDRLARWYEYVGRYTTARGLHARALQLTENRQGLGSRLAVDALRGLTRTYYLEYIYGPEETESGGDPYATSAAPPPVSDQTRLNPDGERALRIALAALAKATPPDHRANGETLVELGDWYLIGGATGKALITYRESWTELQSAGPEALKLLSAPRRLGYRPPSVSVTRLTPSRPEDYEERFVEARFTVGPDGKISEVETATTDAPAAVERAVLFAVRKARYAPRLENGEAVVTKGVTLRERVFVKKAAQPAAGSATP